MTTKQLILLLLSAASAGPTTIVSADVLPTTAEVMAALGESDWRTPSPGDLLYMRVNGGEVIIELAPNFAPQTVANIKTLVREKYFDGLFVIRTHDNYVVQWGDPAEDEAQMRSLGSAVETISPEFHRPVDGVKITVIDSRDAYADTVGFADGFPVGSDGGRVWPLHCYGMLGVARGMDADSGNGSSLYIVSGHAPRHLDKNLAVPGRVLAGIEFLTALPRGTGPLGFFETREEYIQILNVRMGDELAEEDRADIQVLRTDTAAFDAYVASRTTRNEAFFVDPTGRIGICNINPPVNIN